MFKEERAMIKSSCEKLCSLKAPAFPKYQQPEKEEKVTCEMREQYLNNASISLIQISGKKCFRDTVQCLMHCLYSTFFLSIPNPFFEKPHQKVHRQKRSWKCFFFLSKVLYSVTKIKSEVFYFFCTSLFSALLLHQVWKLTAFKRN